MINKKEFCDYDTCVALIEVKYPRGSIYYYKEGNKRTIHQNGERRMSVKTAIANGYIPAITVKEAFDFMWKEKHMPISINGYWKGDGSLHKLTHVDATAVAGEIWRSSWEEAALRGVKKAIRKLKRRK